MGETLNSGNFYVNILCATAFFCVFFGREMCQNEYEVAPKFDPAKCWIPITLHILLLQMVAMERERERER